MAMIQVHVPDEIDEFSPNLRYFFETMVRKLHANRHKGFGRGKKFDQIMEDLGVEVEELERAIAKESQFDVQLEAVDVANFGFLVALRAYGLNKQQFNEEQQAKRPTKLSNDGIPADSLGGFPNGNS